MNLPLQLQPTLKFEFPSWQIKKYAYDSMGILQRVKTYPPTVIKIRCMWWFRVHFSYILILTKRQFKQRQIKIMTSLRCIWLGYNWSQFGIWIQVALPLSSVYKWGGSPSPCTKHLKYPQKKTLFSLLIRMKQEGWNKPTRSWLKLKPHKYLILVFYQSYPQPPAQSRLKKRTKIS